MLHERTLSDHQLSALTSAGVVVESDLAFLLLKDGAGLCHVTDWCSAFSAAAAGARYVGVRSLPGSLCGECGAGDAPRYVVEDDLRLFVAAYLEALREVTRSPRGATFAALAQLASLRAAREALAAGIVPEGVSAAREALLARVDARLAELAPAEAELRVLMRTWVAADLLCNLSDGSAWPADVLEFFGPEPPRWLYRELVQAWRARSSSKEKVRRRATPDQVQRRLGASIPRNEDISALRSRDAEDFAAALESLCVHLDGELARLVALPEERCYLVARSEQVVDMASRQVLEASSSSRVFLADELTGRWVQARADLSPQVQAVRVAGPLDVAVLEVVEGLFDPAASQLEDSPASSLEAVLEMAEGILSVGPALVAG